MEHIIDATNQKLGRLATRVAHILQDKHKVSYEPRLAGGDSVVIKNASKVALSGKKFNQKVYYWHTGYMGHLRERSVKDMMVKYPERVVEWAVYNMLPKNNLRPKRMLRLKIEK